MTSRGRKPRLMIVGAFPDPSRRIYGGILTNCSVLVESSIRDHFDLILIDSTLRSIPAPPLIARVLYAIPRVLKFLTLVAMRRPDVLLLFASNKFSFLEKALYGMYAKWWGTTVIFSPRSGEVVGEARRSEFVHAYMTWLMRFPDAFLCQGASWTEFLTDELGVAPEKCHVVRNWTATPDLLDVGRERDYHVHDPVRIIFVGWLDRAKGVFELVQAFTALLQDHAQLQLVMAGEGDASAALRDLIHERGLEDSVRLVGWVDQEGKRQVLQEGTIFCLPSHVEGLPNAMIEAMAAGLPVVVTPVGAVPTVIVDGQNGIITEVGNVPELEGHLRHLVEEPSARERLGRAGFAFANENFNVDKAVEEIVRMSGI